MNYNRAPYLNAQGMGTDLPDDMGGNSNSHSTTNDMFNNVPNYYQPNGSTFPGVIPFSNASSDDTTTPHAPEPLPMPYEPIITMLPPNPAIVNSFVEIPTPLVPVVIEPIATQKKPSKSDIIKKWSIIGLLVIAATTLAWYALNNKK